MPDSVELTSQECRRLLSTGLVGRVAWCIQDGPHVVPVSYALDEDSVVFRTSPYSLLGRTARNSMMAFEVEHLEAGQDRSWSVEVRGRCRSVDDAEQIQQLEQTSSPQPWATGSRHLFLRIEWTEISGRRLELPSSSRAAPALSAAVDGQPG